MTSVSRIAGLVAMLALALCARRPRSPLPQPTTRTHMALDASVSDDGGGDVHGDVPAARPGLSGVIEAVRREDWATAADRWTRLTASDQRSREGRYLGGRIAHTRGELARAAELLHGLELNVPELAISIARLEGNCLAGTGRAAEARALFERLAERTGSDRDRARAAELAQDLGDLPAAARVMRTWGETPPPGFDRASALRRAARVLEATGDSPGAVRAWKRLATDEPDSAHSPEALAALARLSSPLSTDELLDRAHQFVERARYEPVIAELGALAPGQGRAEARRLHLLGRAYFFSRAHYSEAHSTLLAAAAMSTNTDRDEDAFLAARSLARADRDVEALSAYDSVARTVRGHWGDDAAFRALWIVARTPRIDDAVARAEAYLRDRPDAAPAQRSEAAWEEGWALFQVGRFLAAAAALERSSELAPRALERGRGRYWAALAWLRAGQAERAVRTWQSIITERPLTYYAILGETRLRERNIETPPPRPPSARRPTPDFVLSDDVQWLHTLGFDHDAASLLLSRENELRPTLPSDRADEVLALAYVELGEAHRAYALAQQHGDLLDHEPTPEARWAWDCAYPRPYAYWVHAAEDANSLPRDYLFAIMRQESAFNTRDVSNARAIGLLQMIPPTTRRVAQTLGIEWREELLFDPEYNIRVGGYYIGRLYAQYGGILPRAIGAFNGGPGAMGRWVRRWPELDVDEFAERIPFDETRTYVRRVMQNLARYRYLYNGGSAAPPLLRTRSTADAGVQQLVDY